MRLEEPSSRDRVSAESGNMEAMEANEVECKEMHWQRTPPRACKDQPGIVERTEWNVAKDLPSEAGGAGLNKAGLCACLSFPCLCPWAATWRPASPGHMGRGLRKEAELEWEKGKPEREMPDETETGRWKGKKEGGT